MPRIWTRLVETGAGAARLTTIGPRADTTLVLGHGAGGGTEAIDLQVMASAAVAAGYRVVLVEQPWRVAGRRIAPRPAALDEAWITAVNAIPAARIVVGGRSAGARVACRTAGALGARGVIALAFPLHPPGRPAASRADELALAGVPTLVVQGERDAFGTPGELAAAAPGVPVVAVGGADHALRCGRDEGRTRVELAAAAAEVVAFLDRLP